MARLLGALSWLMLVGTSVSASSRPGVIDLPVGFLSAAIALGEEWTVYVGSLLDGSIWKGDLSTGEGDVVVSGDSSILAVGMAHDRRSGYLFVAGGPSGIAVVTLELRSTCNNVYWVPNHLSIKAYLGTVRIYNSQDFSVVAEVQLAGTNQSSLVNDVIFTKTAAYLTDSFQRQIYSVPLDRYSGELVGGEDAIATTIPLSSNFPMSSDYPNANGIEVTDDGKALIVVNMASGELYTVDPESGEAALIDLGGEVLLGGDGLVRRKNTLWVVQNTYTGGSFSQIAEVSLSADLTCGSVAPRALVNELFDDPATAVRKGNSLYVVSNKFESVSVDLTTTPYEIVRVDRDGGEYACSEE